MMMISQQSKGSCWLSLLLPFAIVKTTHAAYGHFTEGAVSNCEAPSCGDFTVAYPKIRASLVEFIEGEGSEVAKQVDDFGQYWEDYSNANGNGVPLGYCEGLGGSYTRQSVTYPGISYSKQASTDEFVITSNSVPNHSIEDYCSAQGGSLPPLIGTDINQVRSDSITRLPSNSYREELGVGEVGIAVNGVIIFTPFTFIETVAATDETLDVCNGHPANGLYHYHGFSPCLFGEDSTQTNPTTHSNIYGWSFDGFPIYGPFGYDDPLDDTSSIVRIQSGYEFTGRDDTKPRAYDYTGSGHLDRCNGRYTKTPEFPNGMYVYYLNVDADGKTEFPGVPYCYQSKDGSGRRQMRELQKEAAEMRQQTQLRGGAFKR